MWSSHSSSLFVAACHVNMSGAISAKKCGAQRSRKGGCASPSALSPSMSFGLPFFLLLMPELSVPYKSSPQYEQIPSKIAFSPTFCPFRYQRIAPVIFSSEVQAFPTCCQPRVCRNQSRNPKSSRRRVNASWAVRGHLLCADS